jgi:hypothetical protein
MRTSAVLRDGHRESVLSRKAGFQSMEASEKRCLTSAHASRIDPLVAPLSHAGAGQAPCDPSV